MQRKRWPLRFAHRDWRERALGLSLTGGWLVQVFPTSPDLGRGSDLGQQIRVSRQSLEQYVNSLFRLAFHVQGDAQVTEELRGIRLDGERLLKFTGCICVIPFRKATTPLVKKLLHARIGAGIWSLLPVHTSKPCPGARHYEGAR